METIQISEGAKKLLSRLSSSGYSAYIVGGSVRDMLRGVKPSDYDMTTEATPDEIKRVFSDLKTVDTGIKHGTVTVIYDGVPYEITTYRTELGYTDNRHPDGVVFTRSLAEDLKRRDFTVNAMCLGESGEVIDLFGGAKDLEKKIIRAVGVPSERFSEDALRILRALRFAAVLDFEIEEETARAARELSHLLQNISRERVYTELKKLLSGAAAYSVLSDFSDVISVIVPELSGLVLPDRERFERASGTVRLLSLFAATCGGECALKFGTAMASLKTDSRVRRLGAAVLGSLDKHCGGSEAELLALTAEIGEEYARQTVSLRYVLTGRDNSEELLAALKSGIPYRVGELEVNGDDLKEIGLSGGEIGAALTKILYAVIQRKIPNEKQKIIEYILG